MKTAGTSSSSLASRVKRTIQQWWVCNWFADCLGKPINRSISVQIGALKLVEFIRLIGGGGGIRTHETVARLPVFKTGAFNHSATPPENRCFASRRFLRSPPKHGLFAIQEAHIPS